MTPIVHDEYQGVRVTPNLYTTLDEVDTFAGAMEALPAARPNAPARDPAGPERCRHTGVVALRPETAYGHRLPRERPIHG